MTTRATMIRAAHDEIPSKRRRVEMSLEDVNDSCLLVILTFLPAEDLNSFAICSRRCSEARSSPLLDQTRTGTIICSKNTTVLQIYDAISRGGWNNDLYSGNRTRLRIIGIKRVVDTYIRVEDVRRHAHRDDVQLTGVTSLDLSYSPHDWDGTVRYQTCYRLALILPNLRELHLSYVQAAGIGIQQFCDNCPHLARLTWNCAGRNPFRFYFNGRNFRNASNLTKVYMDGAQFYSPLEYHENDWADELINGGPNVYMLMDSKHLERVSIKNTRFTFKNSELRPVSQGMIMKFVRHTPTLRWLRSDLTEENVAMLQQERPDITFVMDKSHARYAGSLVLY